MTGKTPPRPLSAWDRRLLRQHLAFYKSLDTEARPPSSPAQARFVEFCRGNGHFFSEQIYGEVNNVGFSI